MGPAGAPAERWALQEENQAQLEREKVEGAVEEQMKGKIIE